MPKNPLLSNTHKNIINSNNVWPMVKPFANGGVVGVIDSSVGYFGFFGFNYVLLLTAKPENVAHIKPMVDQVNTALLKVLLLTTTIPPSLLFSFSRV